MNNHPISFAFLDILIYIDKNGQLQKILHSKLTNSYNYFYFKSCHPQHRKVNVIHMHDD